MSEACAKFEAASHLTTTAGVRLNLAGCWAKMGRTASAWGMYDEARALADRSGDAAAAELAQRGKAELEPKLSRLVVSVAPANAAGLTVTRDGEPVFSGAWGVGVPVDPGDHDVAARAPGHKDWSSKVSVNGEGAQVTVTVPVLDAGEARTPVAAAATPRQRRSRPEPGHGRRRDRRDGPASSSSRGSTQRIVGIVTGGVGLVALGIGAYFGVKTASDKSDYQGNEVNGKCINLACQTQSQDAVSAGNVSTVFVIAGAALVAGGVVVWLTAPKAHESGVRAHLAPTVTMRTRGCRSKGSW